MTAHHRSDPADVPDYLALFRQDGRVWMVVGGGDGIGRQAAHALAQAGATVGVLDRDAKLAQDVAAEVGGLALTADAVDRADLGHAFAALERAYGRIDGVIDIEAYSGP